MHLGKRTVLIVGGLALPMATACGQEIRMDEEAIRIVERSKAVDATYASYIWNRISLPGQPAVEEWSAEFHSGSRHRVETPRDRVIADCKVMTGTLLSLTTGEMTTGPEVAAAACGINTNRSFRSGRLLGTVEGRFGATDRVELSDVENLRTYEVTRDGIIVRGTYARTVAPDVRILESWTVALDREVPTEGMFSEQSLARSFVPAKYKVAPDTSSN